MVNFNIELLPKQLVIFNDKHRFKICCTGRRWGKTTLASIIISLAALSKPNGVFWIVSPTFSQSDIMWNMIKRLFLQNPDIRNYVQQIKEGVRCIILVNGSTIWSKSGDHPDALRGEGLDGVVLDECAILKPDVWYEAIQPALIDKMGWAMLISTPKGKNWFYTEFLRGSDVESLEYKSFRYSSYDNPILSREALDRMREKMPELAYQQEIMAQFVEGGGTVFRNVMNCLHRPTMKPEKGKFYIAGVDLAKYQDWTVVIIVDAETGNVEGFYRWNRIDWQWQKNKISIILREWNNAVAYMDATGIGEPIVEELSQVHNVQGVVMSATVKPQLIENYSLLMDNGGIRIPDDEIVVNEHSSYSFEMTDTGKIKFGAPSGFHDDTVMACALAAYGISQGAARCIGQFMGEKSKWDDMESVLVDEAKPKRTNVV